MNRKKTGFMTVGLGVLLFALLRLPVSLWAQDGPEQEHALEAIVVTAEKPSRSQQTGDVNLEATPSFYSLITRDQFEGKVESLAEVIEKEAGVQVRQAGGLGSFSTVSLRGSSSEQVLVFLDGILLNDASGGGVDLSTISLSDVDSIEIFKGITPMSFGRSSIGGAVNIRTLRAGKGLHGNVSAGYGSFDTWQTSGYVNHKPGALDYLASASYLTSKNNFTFTNDRGTTWNPRDDREEERHNAQFKENNFLGKLGYDFSENVRIDVMDQWFAKDQGLPAWNNSRKAKTSFSTDRNIAVVKLTANDLGPHNLNTSSFLDCTHQVEEYDDSLGQLGLGKQRNRYITDRIGGHFLLDWRTEKNTLTPMLDVQHETYEPRDLLNPKNRIGESSRNSISSGLQDNLYLFQERLILTPALRYTFIMDERNSAVNLWGKRVKGTSVSEGSWNPQLGAKYQVLENLFLKSNIARYVREPAFYELFGDRGFFIGNPELKPEVGINFDLGFEAGWKGSGLWLQNISASSAVFHNQVEDLITLVYDARGIGKYVNISDALIQGIENTLKIEFLKHLRFIGTATWQNPVQESEIKVFNDKVLPGRFQESFLARLEAFWGPAKIYGEFTAQSGLFYDAANLLKAKPQALINVGGSFSYRAVTVSVDAKNLGNDQYEDFNGYPMPGRSAYVTVQYKF